jgi:hypothetical protein
MPKEFRCKISRRYEIEMEIITPAIVPISHPCAVKEECTYSKNRIIKGR